MGWYRKKPVVIQAHQWFKNGDHPDDQSKMLSGILQTDESKPNEKPVKGQFLSEGLVVRRFRHPMQPGTNVCSKCKHTMHEHGWIDTLEDGHNVCPGDYIVTGVQGERYPCKPDIFAQTYEQAEAPTI